MLLINNAFSDADSDASGRGTNWKSLRSSSSSLMLKQGYRRSYPLWRHSFNKWQCIQNLIHWLLWKDNIDLSLDPKNEIIPPKNINFSLQCGFARVVYFWARNSSKTPNFVILLMRFWIHCHLLKVWHHNSMKVYIPDAKNGGNCLLWMSFQQCLDDFKIS